MESLIGTHCRGRGAQGAAPLLEGSAASFAAVLLPVRDTNVLYCPLPLIAYEQDNILSFSQPDFKKFLAKFSSLP